MNFWKLLLTVLLVGTFASVFGFVACEGCDDDDDDDGDDDGGGSGEVSESECEDGCNKILDCLEDLGLYDFGGMRDYAFQECVSFCVDEISENQAQCIADADCGELLSEADPCDLNWEDLL